MIDIDSSSNDIKENILDKIRYLWKRLSLVNIDMKFFISKMVFEHKEFLRIISSDFFPMPFPFINTYKVELYDLIYKKNKDNVVLTLTIDNEKYTSPAKTIWVLPKFYDVTRINIEYTHRVKNTIQFSPSTFTTERVYKTFESPHTIKLDWDGEWEKRKFIKL